MKFRLIKPQPDVSVDYLMQRWEKCRAQVEVYWKARKEHRRLDAHDARLKIATFAPTIGVYRYGYAEDYYVVYGAILASKKLLSPERLFVVPMLPIREIRKGMEIDDVEAIGAWRNVPFTDTDGWMSPIVGDTRRKRRGTKVAEVVHC